MPSVGMPAEQTARRFRVGEVPPLAEGFTDRPDTASGIVDALVPGSAVALVPGSPLAEGQQAFDALHRGEPGLMKIVLQP